ncbi:MAG TPA: HEAT repeat domain-containing protein, partial [Gemmatales bacterium]|nr:HEAT repeat domain-containing protein [Gemmatales bacterium]
KSDFIKGTIVDVFAQRADNRIVPDLYHLSQAASSTPALQEKAKEWLMRFLFKTEKEITDAKEQLVATSDSYHQHKVNLDGQKLHVWKWDDQEGLTGTPATKSQVEEALGVAYARKALDLDPSYRPAQVQLLSVALDKLYENAGPNVSVAEVNPNLQALLAGSPADLLEEVLAKALRDNKPSAALGAIRALGIHGDPRVLSFSERGSPPLLQALRYPDRRVRFAAAEAALAINSKGEAYPGSSRVLEVLKHAATGYGTQRILIGLGNREEANKLADQLRLLQYDVSVFGSGRQLLSEAASHGNVGLIIVDAALPDPGFSYFLAQYKNQPNTSGMPMLVIADKDQGRFASDSLAKQPNVKVIASVPQSQALIDSEVKSMLSDKTKPAISDAEREAQAKAAVD